MAIISFCGNKMASELLRWLPLLLLALAVAAASGCQKDEIEHYQAPRLEIPVQEKQAGIQVPLRMITAIFSQKDRTWFFKLSGQPDEIEKHKQEFEHFIQSVRFTKKGDPPVIWTVPEGWQREAGAGLRFASFRFGDKDNPLELTVTPLGREAGSLSGNVKRWRGQLGLKDIDEAELAKTVRELEVDGVKAMIVDLTGTGSGKAPMNAPFAKGRPPSRERPAKGREENATSLPLTFQAPVGWKERAQRDAITLVAYQIPDGNQMAEVTITAAGGTLEGNVNRWRGQVGLTEVSEQQIRQEARPIEVDRSPGQYVDLTGPEAAGGLRILAVLVPRGDTTWFFKMRGPADLVGRQKPAFEAFLGTVRFTGG
jgi:hypothetical protein